jgi:uncharacterized protein YjbJ (UPF0337 family)
MDWNRVEGNWKEVKGKVKEKWGKLTDDDLTAIDGQRDQLEGRLQERYGYAKDQARDIEVSSRDLLKCPYPSRQLRGGFLLPWFSGAAHPRLIGNARRKQAKEFVSSVAPGTAAQYPQTSDHTRQPGGGNPHSKYSHSKRRCHPCAAYA